MGERDAFGREKGEDTLAEMGWRAGTPAAWQPPPVAPGDPLAAAPSPAAAPPPAPPVAWPDPAPMTAAPERPRPAPAPTFARRRARRPGPSLARLLIPLAVLGAGFVGVSAAVNAGRDVVNGIHLPTAVRPTGLAPGSLFRPASLRGALAKLPPGRLVSLRVAADQIQAQTVRGGTRHIATVGFDGDVTDTMTPAPPSQPTVEPDTGAPLRMVRTAARRAGRTAGDVDYLVVFAGTWQLFFKDGKHYSANAAGRKVKQVG
jgi:hypothetical protein